MLIMYINLMVYVKMRLAEKWVIAIKIFGTMFVMIPCLQLIMFYIVKFIFILFQLNQNGHILGVVSNCLVCLLIAFWEKEYVFKVARRLGKNKSGLVALVFCFFVIYLLYIYKKREYVYESVTVQLLVTIICIAVVAIFWINAENEKKMKVKELQLYELYNKTFEEAIAVIRVRQHEFENHINAIKCLQMTIDDTNELIKAQNEYCDRVLRENSFNRLLRIQTEPILIGFLYSKFMNAKEQKIEVFHEIHATEFRNKLEIYELIEIIGILVDNAIEALLNEKNIERILVVKLLQVDKEKISIEVANRSRKYLNSEIEKFFVYGYSTKGKNRGVGLSRVKAIVNKNKADLQAENVNYNGDNYLSIKIIFP